MHERGADDAAATRAGSHPGQTEVADLDLQRAPRVPPVQQRALQVQLPVAHTLRIRNLPGVGTALWAALSNRKPSSVGLSRGGHPPIRSRHTTTAISI